MEKESKIQEQKLNSTRSRKFVPRKLDPTNAPDVLMPHKALVAPKSRNLSQYLEYEIMYFTCCRGFKHSNFALQNVKVKTWSKKLFSHD